MRYLLGFFIGIGLIVLIVILIVKGLSGPAKPPYTPLVDYAGTNVEAMFTIDGPEVSNQDHQSVQITVNQYQTQINIMDGYQGNVVNSKSYPNNQASYAVFLRALDIAGYSHGNTDPNKVDDRGYCPFGDRYVYELSRNGSDMVHFWSSSCGVGTFQGQASTVNNLFIDQIPDYNTLTSGLRL
jgi:hypothetical protein